MYKQYKNLDGSTCETGIIRTSDYAFIPFDPANTDYQAYLKWVEEGNTPLPAITEGNNSSATLNMESN